jgi:hypothetical protein
MRSKLWLILAICIVAMFISSSAMAAKLLCVSRQDLKGGETVSSCLLKGDEFAIVDDNDIVHILTPREIELTRMFNPKLFGQRAYSLQYKEQAPEINPLKRRAVFGPNQ